MLVSLQNLEKSYGSDIILDHMSASIDEKERIGLIGRNGSGKTTLFRILTKMLDHDGGNIIYKNDLKIGFLKQDLALCASNTMLEEVTSVYADLIMMEQELASMHNQIEKESDPNTLAALTETYHQKYEFFQGNKGFYFRGLVVGALKGLGFKDDQQSMKISQLSGGQRMRVALAKLLLTEPDLLLLDEPTNYLDLSSISWLESYLCQYPKTYVIISHDRYFLEKTVNVIWELSNGTLTRYKGNYSSYQKQKEHNDYENQRAYENQQKYLKRQEEVIEKLKSYNREKSVKRAESREKLLSKIERIDRPQIEQVSKIRFNMTPIISKNALILDRVVIGYNESPLSNEISMHIKPGETIGICGDNAAGKSTLLKTISGDIPQISGEMMFGSGADVSYFRQHHEDLDPEQTIVDELCAYSGADTLTVRNILGRLLFSGEDVYKKISMLSGGEKSRVAIAKLMLTKSNILLMDEPTNHLDIESREAFEEALRAYEGTVFVVSHDRYLLNALAGRMIFFENGMVYCYDEPYEKANQHFLSQIIQVNETQKKDTTIDLQSADQIKKTDKLSKNKIRQYQTRILQIEERIDQIEKEKEEIEKMMLDDQFYRDAQHSGEVLANYEAIKQEKESIEEEWLDIHDQLENNDS